MSPTAQRRFDFQWRRGHLAALLALCLVASAGLGGRAWRRPREVARRIGVQERRVALARERIDPNTASVASLRRLPGVGPAKAQAIVDFRETHGPVAFRSLGDLERVPGIGPVIAESMGPYVSIPALPGRARQP